jgi:thiamine biosynthesis lipoprotein
VEARELDARVMASELQITVTADAGTDDRCLADAAALLDHLEHRWSRFLPDSDITRLNNAGGAATEVDDSTLTLLSAMIEGWDVTGGRFDPSILPSLCAAGYDRSIDDPRRVTLLPDGSAHVGGFDATPSPADIDIDVARRRVRVPAGLVLDAGGIGKGLAADLAVDRLIDRGAAGALVSIGGDIVARGTPPPDADDWVIAVEDPLDGGSTRTIAMSQGGVATSSTRSRRWRTPDGERHHTIDPVTAAPSTTDLAAVTVIARSGWLAEVHATAALLAGSRGAVEHLDRHDLSGLAIGLDGTVAATNDLHLLAMEETR